MPLLHTSLYEPLTVFIVCERGSSARGGTSTRCKGASVPADVSSLPVMRRAHGSRVTALGITVVFVLVATLQHGVAASRAVASGSWCQRLPNVTHGVPAPFCGMLVGQSVLAPNVSLSSWFRQQEVEVVDEIETRLLGYQYLSPACMNAIRYEACLTHFTVCNQTNSSSHFTPTAGPCVAQCESLNACGTLFNTTQCASLPLYHSTNCTAILPPLPVPPAAQESCHQVPPSDLGICGDVMANFSLVRFMMSWARGSYLVCVVCVVYVLCVVCVVCVLRAAVAGACCGLAFWCDQLCLFVLSLRFSSRLWKLPPQASMPSYLHLSNASTTSARVASALDGIAPQLPSNACQRALRYLLCQEAFPACGAPHQTPQAHAARPCPGLCHHTVSVCGPEVVDIVGAVLDCDNPLLYSNTSACMPLRLPAANSCPLHCSGHGTCDSSGECVCDLDWYGVDCSSQYCEGTVRFAVPESGAPITFMGTNVRNSANCTWVVDAPDVSLSPVTGLATRHVTLSFPEFHSGWSTVDVYDGSEVDKSRLLRTFATTVSFTPDPNAATLIQPVMSLVGTLTINLLTQGSAFNLYASPFTARVQASCLDTCRSPRGYCTPSGRCVCQEGWYGVGCNSTFCSGTAVIAASDQRGSDMVRDKRYPQPGKVAST